ncbi:MAG: T9SS type A sorting domain-containing protein [Saprospiraceae bacterium]|nr:T9SS type A sorting domain-containing protein [Saprospiraceae bacterium]MBK8512542.1 T9SS type A sorting domain-containing protein [Saprospiraceae bacterium]MBK9931122.1 T9SS type A sorting domain-containing protein [Saprospiraceae bacterium]MBP7801675.1 T9SS type A sorting domain-containing protein [Saprospiraceae bacterium]MBP7923774.1 T9SS type A sorting domain-containing protein [Saprospiraceae bacterium]
MIRIFFWLFMVLIIIPSDTKGQSGQLNIPRVDLMPNQPAPYNMLHWSRVAQQYDSFVYDVQKQGQYLPLVSVGMSGINYPSNKTIRLHSYVGSPDGSEAINVLPSLVGASLNGINKSSQFGQDWVTMSQDFFNKANGENIYLNNAGANSGSDWWYDVMPNLFFYQLFDLYPDINEEAKGQFKIIADRFISSVKTMGGSDTPWKVPNMNYRAWSFKNMQGNALGVKEPEASGAYAWILYHAYKASGDKAYLEGAEWAIEFLNNYPTNPSYELQLPYGTAVAAKMNAELGTTYNIPKMVNWSFDKGALRNWGTIVGTWGGLHVSGLVGEANDGGDDYAFQLNGVQQAAALVPMVRYDKRFSKAIGKWVLNLANATRLFYPGYLPASLQDASDWSALYDPNQVIGYEALRQKLNGLSPVSTGDALKGGWAGTNLSLYSSSSIGYLGAIVETTNVEKILKLDLLKTDFFHDTAYPTYLLYNPYSTVQTVLLDIGPAAKDLYDALTETFVAKNVTGRTSVLIPGDQALQLVLAPSNALVRYDHNLMLLDDVVVDYRQTNQTYTKPVRIKALAASTLIVQVNDSIDIYITAEDPDGGIILYAWNASGGFIKGSTDRVRWLSPAVEGKYIIKATVKDDHGNQVSDSIEMMVVNRINLAPQIMDIQKSALYTARQGVILFTCVATDPNLDTLRYSWTSTGGVFNNPGNASVQWTAPDLEGIYTITVKTTDQGNLSDQITFSVLVKDFKEVGGNLIAYYPFNNSAMDVSGHQLHGEASGTVFVPDRTGKALAACYFNGGSQHIIVQNNVLLNNQNAISASCWFNAVKLGDKESFLLSHGSWQNRWKLSLTTDKRLRWTINTLNGIADLDAPEILATDKFYHVTACYDGQTMTLYLNGSLVAYKSLTGSIRTTTLPLLMGQMLPDVVEYNFKGVIDEVKLFDYALTPAAALTLYTESTTALKSRFPLSEFTLKLSPNPTSTFLTIQYPADLGTTAHLFITNMTGQSVFEKHLPFSRIAYERFDIHDYPAGIYIIGCQSEQKIYLAKFIKL